VKISNLDKSFHSKKDLANHFTSWSQNFIFRPNFTAQKIDSVEV